MVLAGDADPLQVAPSSCCCDTAAGSGLDAGCQAAARRCSVPDDRPEVDLDWPSYGRRTRGALVPASAWRSPRPASHPHARFERVLERHQRRGGAPVSASALDWRPAVRTRGRDASRSLGRHHARAAVHGCRCASTLGCRPASRTLLTVHRMRWPAWASAQAAAEPRRLGVRRRRRTPVEIDLRAVVGTQIVCAPPRPAAISSGSSPPYPQHEEGPDWSGSRRRQHHASASAPRPVRAAQPGSRPSVRRTRQRVLLGSQRIAPVCCSRPPTWQVRAAARARGRDQRLGSRLVAPDRSRHAAGRAPVQKRSAAPTIEVLRRGRPGPQNPPAPIAAARRLIRRRSWAAQRRRRAAGEISIVIARARHRVRHEVASVGGRPFVSTPRAVPRDDRSGRLGIVERDVASAAGEILGDEFAAEELDPPPTPRFDLVARRGIDDDERGRCVSSPILAERRRAPRRRPTPTPASERRSERHGISAEAWASAQDLPQLGFAGPQSSRRATTCRSRRRSPASGRQWAAHVVSPTKARCRRAPPGRAEPGRAARRPLRISRQPACRGTRLLLNGGTRIALDDERQDEPPSASRRRPARARDRRPRAARVSAA